MDLAAQGVLWNLYGEGGMRGSHSTLCPPTLESHLWLFHGSLWHTGISRPEPSAHDCCCSSHVLQKMKTALFPQQSQGPWMNSSSSSWASLSIPFFCVLWGSYFTVPSWDESTGWKKCAEIKKGNPRSSPSPHIDGPVFSLFFFPLS
jgi:hypothetical protein